MEVSLPINIFERKDFLNQKVHNLGIGEIFIDSQGMNVSTILGSCVSVCLFSESASVGGVIHFALPDRSFAQKSMRNELNFGDSAIRILYDKLINTHKLRHSDLRAKIVGGASVVDNLESNFNIGELNIQIARQVLSELNIPVIGEHVGGYSGRKIYFYTDTGRLRVSLTNTTINKKVRVLVVDDSKTIQELLKRIINSGGIEVVGVASNATEADKLIKELRPDVITLDIHMPGIDGVSFLERFLPHYPIPTIMISSINMNESNLVLKTLEIGAVDYIQKPTLNEITALTEQIREKIITASSIKVIPHQLPTVSKLKAFPGSLIQSNKIVVIGASTGGTEAIKEVLLRLPANIPPILIVQHIPAVFSNASAKRLNDLCPFEVIEGQDGDEIKPGRVIIAPGGRHMELWIEKNKRRVRIFEGEKVNRHIPSVDVLFNSAAKWLGHEAVGVILTGMGNDGARGLLNMKQSGAFTIGQDEKTSVVFGMPKAAQELNAVSKVIPLENIADEILDVLTVSEYSIHSLSLGGK